MALSDFHMTEKDAETVLSCYLHSKILEIFAYGIYTVIYCVAVYLTCKFAIHFEVSRSD